MVDERGVKAGQITIKDIAQTLGVSHATVSRALHDSPLISQSTKSRIRAMAAELGYIPDSAARVMRGGASNIVGFILPDVQNHFYSTIAKVLAEAVAPAGLQLVLAISGDDPEQELRHVKELRRARAKGIVITPVARMLSETSALLREMRVVQLVRSHPDVVGDVVAAQDAAATRMSTKHLLSLGHRRIAYLGGGAETLSTGLHRLEGYRSAMAGVADAVPAYKLIPPHPENGYLASMELLRGIVKPTGLVIGSSQLALGVLRACSEIGLTVPTDLSLVSYDDPDWHQLWGPGISTIELPIREMAHFAARKIYLPDAGTVDASNVLIDELEHGQSFSFPVRLRERGSCREICAVNSSIR
ncbi:MAG: LacI family DNA-binding transcriptional regulator [Pseudolabrys sp.]|nr:LacI family DNA-binding transcriptional regulator [Pseudolabrys sp.]MDP2298487.1 LacI family DNA-binding transcriptional regulator [Pseudolabrys sp.]